MKINPTLKKGPKLAHQTALDKTCMTAAVPTSRDAKKGESFVECGSNGTTAQQGSGEHATARAWLRGGLALTLILTFIITLTQTAEHLPQWVVQTVQTVQSAQHDEHSLKLSRHGVKYWETGDDSAEVSDTENGWHKPSTKMRMQMLQWKQPFFGNVQTKIVKSLLQTEMTPVNAFMPPMIPLLPPQPQNIGPIPNPLYPQWQLYAPIILSASASPVVRGPCWAVCSYKQNIEQMVQDCVQQIATEVANLAKIPPELP